MYYFDNAASSLVLKDAIEQCLPYLNQLTANPSSLHKEGVQARTVINQSRRTIAEIINANADNILFTSGATEANNLALMGSKFRFIKLKHNYICSALEHPSVLECQKVYDEAKIKTHIISPLNSGIIDLEKLKLTVDKDTKLVSLMMVNNEIGTQQPIAAALKIVRQVAPRALFHVDATQGFCKLPIDLKKMGIDMLTASGHKIGSPKGVGFLALKNKDTLNKISFGGNQEFGLRSGTENVFAIKAFGLVSEIANKNKSKHLKDLSAFKTRWLNYLQQNHPQIFIYNSPHALPHFINIGIKDIPAEVLLHHLETENIFVSTGSACSTHKKNTVSKVIKSLKLGNDFEKSMVRLSFSPLNLNLNLDQVFKSFSKAIKPLI